MLRIRLSILSMLLLLFTFPLLAQAEPGIEDIDPANTFLSVTLLASAVLTLTSIVKKKLQTNDGITIVLSGIISAGLSALGWYLQIGMFIGLEWWYIIVYAGAAMVIANGLSTWGLISAILKLFRLKVPANNE